MPGFRDQCNGMAIVSDMRRIDSARPMYNMQEGTTVCRDLYICGKRRKTKTNSPMQGRIACLTGVVQVNNHASPLLINSQDLGTSASVIDTGVRS